MIVPTQPQKPTIKIDSEANTIHISSRRVTLAKIFQAANAAALQQEVFQRHWKVCLRNVEIASIRLAH